MAKARQQYFADEVTLQKESRDFSITPEIIEKLDGIEEGAQVNVIETVKVNGTALAPDANKAVNVEVPDVIDNLFSTSTDDALSAKQGKVLYDYLQNIASRGRYLSNWNCVTGLAVTNPSESPYPYKSGDYFVVSNVAGLGGTNYRPDGTQYIIGQASTVVETDNVDVSDFYFYDGTTWLLLKNSSRSGAVDSALSTTSTNPVENRVVTNAINGKQDTLVAGTNIQIASDGKTISATDTTYSAGTNVSIDANNEISAVDTTYTAGANIQISNQNVISATDTVYAAGTNVQINNNVISATDTTYVAGDFDIKDLADSTGLRTEWSGKQDELIAGNNIQIAADGKTISAIDTTYTAGTGISIDSNNVISNTQTSAEWGNITGTLSSQTDLQSALNAKANSSDVNTKTFTITGSVSPSDIYAAIQWYLDGKTPIIAYKAYSYDEPELFYLRDCSIVSEASLDRYGLLFVSPPDKNEYPGQYRQLVINAKIRAGNIIEFDDPIVTTENYYTASTGVSISNGVISNTGVLSVNGQTGDVTIASPDMSNYLAKDNTTAFTPTGDYQPATKKYVDDNKTEYHAGEGIEIGAIQDYSAMQGPAPDGFHVPLTTEWQAVYDVWTALGGGSSAGTSFGKALKLPFAGYRNYSSAGVRSQGTLGRYWSSSRYNANNAYYLYFNSTALNPQNRDYRANGFSVRCFKNSPVVPPVTPTDSGWISLYGTHIVDGQVVGILRNDDEGIISMRANAGDDWITIADKNLGATTVWNDGDTLSEANCGKYYQWGNNYGFPRTGTITNQSTTQVDASAYGPGNYYSSSTFITYSGRWDTTDNGNLRGGETGVVTIENAITNTGVLSVNGQTGDVTISHPIAELTTSALYYDLSSASTIAAGTYKLTSSGKTLYLGRKGSSPLWVDVYVNGVSTSGNGILIWNSYTDWSYIDGKNIVRGTDAFTYNILPHSFGDMSYSDFQWRAKLGTTITLDLASTITPSANFTVNAPDTLKDGQTYILRVNNGATAYTMTLGTGITNPFGTSLALTANGVDQFVFLAIGGDLELQPEIEGGSGGVTSVNGQTGDVTVQETLTSGTNIKTINNTSLLGSGNIAVQASLSNITAAEIKTGTATTQRSVTAAALAGGLVRISDQANNILANGGKLWAGTQANYEALGTYDNNTVYLTV